MTAKKMKAAIEDDSDSEPLLARLGRMEHAPHKLPTNDVEEEAGPSRAAEGMAGALRKKRIVSMKDEEGAAAAAAAGSPHGLRLLSPRKSVGRALRGRAAAARPQHDLRAAQMRSLARAAAVCREKEATPPAGELHWQGGQHISLRICFHILLGADKLLSQH